MAGREVRRRELVGRRGDLRCWWVPEKGAQGLSALEQRTETQRVLGNRVQREIIDSFLG